MKRDDKNEPGTARNGQHPEPDNQKKVVRKTPKPEGIPAPKILKYPLKPPKYG